MRSFGSGARERGHNALHPHEARTLHEHGAAIDRLHESVHVGEMLATFAETFHRVP